MAERVGRVGRGGDDSGSLFDEGADPELQGRRRGFRGLMGLLLLATGVGVLYLAWWVMWERSHPAAAAARRAEHGDSAVRLEAIRDLGSLGPHDPEVALPALIEALADPEPANRAKAAESLAVTISGHWTSGPDPDEVRRALIALMGHFSDPDTATRDQAAHAVAGIIDSWNGSAEALGFDAMEAELARLAEDSEAGVRASALPGLAALAHKAAGPPPPRLIAALDDPSEEVRTAAARGLPMFESTLIWLLPSMVKAMEQARPECRPAYFGLLQRFASWQYPEEIADEMIAALIEALGSRDREVRCQAAALVGGFGQDARAAIPALLEMIEHPGEPGSPGPGDRVYWQSSDPAIVAARALGRLEGNRWGIHPSTKVPPDPEIAAAMLELLRAPTAGRRFAAVETLNAYQADDTIVAAFISASRDRDESVRAAGIRALHDCGDRLRERSLEAIREAMEDPSATVRDAAAVALIGFGSGIEPLVPALIRHAERDPDLEVRDASAQALGHIRPGEVSPAVIPLWIEAIERPRTPASLRENLIGALAEFGDAARVAVPAIARALRSAERSAGRQRPPRGMPAPGVAGPRLAVEENIALRRGAAQALGVLGPGAPSAAEAVSALITAIEDPAEEVKLAVAESLAGFGPAAREALPALAEALRRSRANKHLLRAGVLAESIARIDPAAPAAVEAIDFLDEILRSDDQPARHFAERVLTMFGPAAARVIPSLVDLSRRPEVRSNPELGNVAAALGRIAPGRPGSDDAVTALLEILGSDPTPPGLEMVIESLSMFGAAAAPALPRLRELARSDNPTVEAAARKAADAIEGVGSGGSASPVARSDPSAGARPSASARIGPNSAP